MMEERTTTNNNKIRTCKDCGFILGTRPNSRDVDGVCLACVNKENKKKIDWQSRQSWLTEYLRTHNNPDGPYDVAVGVSGGKDSSAIVIRLIENHGVPHDRLLLVHVMDEFAPSQAGVYNLDNLVRTYDLDIINFRCAPRTFIEKTRESFFEKLHPLEWIEKKIYSKPLEIAQAYHIPTVIMGAIYPYSNTDSLEVARKIGFKTLDDFEDWQRQGSADPFTQIDSIGYMMQHWTKFIKFGFQRTSDMACRLVREGIYTREQAEQLIKDRDWVADPKAKKDFCRTIGITESEFDKTVDEFANTDLLIKDANGNWRRKDYMD